MPKSCNDSSGLPLIILKSFHKLGFKDNVIQIMKDLITNGFGTICEISRRTGAARSTTEYLLNELMKRGLVQRKTVNGKSRYVMVGKDRVIDHFRSEQEDKYDFYDNFCKNLEKFLDRTSAQNKYPLVEYYSGTEGIKAVWKKVLESGRNIKIYQPDPRSLFELLPDYSEDFKNIVCATEARFRMISEPVFKNQVQYDFFGLKIHTHYMKRGEINGQSIIIADRNVFFLSYETMQKPRALYIRDESIGRMLGAMFECDWKHTEH